MATAPEKVAGGYRIRWRVKIDGAWKWQQLTEPFLRDAEAAAAWLERNRHEYPAGHSLVRGRAYLVGEAAALRSVGGIATFGAMWEDYCARKRGVWSPRTEIGVRASVSKHFGAWFGRPVAEFTARDLNERWAYLLGEGLAENTAISAIAHVKATLRLAFELGRSPYNPNSRELSDVLHFRINPDQSTRREAVSAEAYAAFVTHATGQAFAVMETMTEIMARVGEVLALRVGDVNLAANTITIAGTMVGHGVRQGWTKQERGRSRIKPRALPISPELAAMLVPYVDGRAPAEPLFVAVDARTGRPRAGGGFWHIDSWRNSVWAPTVERARAAGVVLPDAFTPHCLRHSMATWLAQTLTPAQLMYRTRHASIKMVMRYYHDNDVARAAELAAVTAIRASMRPVADAA